MKAYIPRVGDLVSQTSDWNKQKGDLCIVVGLYGDASVRLHVLASGFTKLLPITSVIKVSQKK